jgi:hypothetical protein
MNCRWDLNSPRLRIVTGYGRSWTIYVALDDTQQDVYFYLSAVLILLGIELIRPSQTTGNPKPRDGTYAIISIYQLTSRAHRQSQFLTYSCKLVTNRKRIPLTIERNALVAAESGNSSTKLWPKSQHFAIRGSRGTAPKNGTRNCLARAAAPPVVAANICDSP